MGLVAPAAEVVAVVRVLAVLRPKNESNRLFEPLPDATVGLVVHPHTEHFRESEGDDAVPIHARSVVTEIAVVALAPLVEQVGEGAAHGFPHGTGNIGRTTDRRLREQRERGHRVGIARVGDRAVVLLLFHKILDRPFERVIHAVSGCAQRDGAPERGAGAQRQHRSPAAGEGASVRIHFASERLSRDMALK